jgi:DNA-binding MarR family transcriptional regulator
MILAMAVEPSLWEEYGFSANPYSTDPIDPLAGGRELLVGRGPDLRAVTRQIRSGASVVALEGDFGVGKTSLAAAAAFDASNWAGEGGPLFLSLKSRLNLKPTDTREDFERRALLAVARTLVDSEEYLAKKGHRLNGVAAIRDWLSSAQINGWTGALGASIAGFGGNLSGSRNPAPNTSSGFSESGVMAVIDGWLSELFPTRSSGGVICFLDNLEELQDSTAALRVMEPLRDPLFKRRGLAWMISGAQGMVRAAYSSPKMTGVFLDPIEVPPLPLDVAPSVVATRIRVLRHRVNAIAPVTPQAFSRVYEAIGSNLRYSLNLAERYAFAVDPDEVSALSESQRDLAFNQWVEAEAERVYAAHASGLSKADWKVFEQLLKLKSGSCSPSEWSDFGYANMSPLLVRVHKLEEANLVTYVVDEADQRRRTISVTDHGRLAYYKRVHS